MDPREMLIAQTVGLLTLIVLSLSSILTAVHAEESPHRKANEHIQREKSTSQSLQNQTTRNETQSGIEYEAGQRPSEASPPLVTRDPDTLGKGAEMVGNSRENTVRGQFALPPDPEAELTDQDGTQ